MAKSLRHTLIIRKEALKFAASHMTTFADGTKEALHGHNYTTEIRADVKGIGVKEMISFSVFKKALAAICEAWDEKTLLAEKSPFLEVKSKSKKETDFTLCGKHYVLPSEEIAWVKVDNITTENLATNILGQLQAALKSSGQLSRLVALEVRVYETPGQGAACRWEAEE